MSDISTVGTRFNGADQEFFDKASGTTVFAYRAAAGATGPIFGSTSDNITARAGGGQGTAVQLTACVNRVLTVATGGDSVKVPVSVAGMQIEIINAGANATNVFPQIGDAINALGANAAFSLPSGKVVTFYCATAGQWHTLLSA